MVTCDYHEEVNWRAMALVKSKLVGAETGPSLSMLPWEEHCLPSWAPPHYQGKFSTKYLEPMEKARKLAVEIWENLGKTCNLKELYTELEGKSSALVSIDPSWPLEMACLDYLIKSGAELRMWQDLMSMMPSASRAVSPAEVLALIVDYEATPTFTFLPISVRASLHAAKAFVSAIHRGLPPNQVAEATGNMKAFTERTAREGGGNLTGLVKNNKKVVSAVFDKSLFWENFSKKMGLGFPLQALLFCRMAYFITDEIDEDGNKKSIAGRDALASRWKRVMVDDGKKVKSYEELNVFQIYSYLLAPPHRATLEVVTKRLLNVSAGGSAASSSNTAAASSKNASSKKKKREHEHDDMVAAKRMFT